MFSTKKKVFQSNSRLLEIDGIRGWAALIVVVFHLSWEIFGVLFPELRSPYLKFFLDGSLAVCVFFVLSGDVLSSGFLNSFNTLIITKLVVKRYFRLVGPILFSCLIVYTIMHLGLIFHHEATYFIHREDWLGIFLPFEQNIFRVFKYALIDVFVDNKIERSYNPFLWPMSIELGGSFMVFSFLAIYKNLKNPLLVSVFAGIYLGLLGSFYALFFTGITYSILRSHSYFSNVQSFKFTTLLSYIGIILVIIIDAILEKYHFKPPQLSILLSTALVYCIYINKSAISFMRNRISKYLGRISFPLYVTHFAVIVSYTSWMIKELAERNLLYFSSAVFIIITSYIIAMVIAELTTRLENKYLNFLNFFVNKLITIHPS